MHEPAGSVCRPPQQSQSPQQLSDLVLQRLPAQTGGGPPVEAVSADLGCAGPAPALHPGSEWMHGTLAKPVMLLRIHDALPRHPLIAVRFVSLSSSGSFHDGRYDWIVHISSYPLPWPHVLWLEDAEDAVH